MPCPFCQRINRDTAQFCSNCGGPLLLKNKYRITGRLGEGGYAHVYRAEQLHLANAPCAIKELWLDPQLTPQQTQQAIKQFEFEAGVLARLDHCALPKVTDRFDENNHYYLVMEYVEGETLQEHLEKLAAPMSEVQVLAIADQLCDALEYLHSRTPPVVHRDVKPHNIKLLPDGKIKLLDFGISKQQPTGGQTNTAVRRAGTPPYAPLEQYSSGGTDSRSDIYSLGVTLYQMLTSRLPPEAPDRASRELISPRRHNPLISEQMDAVVVKALAEKTTERFQDIVEMRTALRRVSDSLVAKTTSAPISAPEVIFAKSIVVRNLAVPVWFISGVLVAVILSALLLFSFASLTNTNQNAQLTIQAQSVRLANATQTIAEQTRVIGQRGATIGAQAASIDTQNTVIATNQTAIASQKTDIAQSQATVIAQAAALAHVQTAIANRILSFEVQANSDWQNTGLYLFKGQNFTLNYVSGRWSACVGCAQVDAGGGYVGSNTNSTLAGCTHLALIGRIASSTLFCAGNSYTGQADQSGILELRANDQGFNDNSGSVVIRIETK